MYWAFAIAVFLVATVVFDLASSLLLYPLLGFVALLLLVGVTSALLGSLGLLGAVQSFGVWGLLPELSWYLAGSFVMGALVYWVLNRPLRFSAGKGASENES